MAARAAAAAAILSLSLAAALAPPAAPAVRFGDRLAPRVPPRAPPGPAPRSAAAQHFADPDYDDSYEYEEQNMTVEEEDAAPATSPPPRRPARTEAHRLEMSTEYFLLPVRAAPAAPPAPAPSPARVVTASTAPPPTANASTAAPPQAPPGVLRQEPWAVPILALACVCMVTIGAFEAFVVWGARRTAPSRRHLLLGQTLLFGVFSCAATAALIVAAPTPFTCGAVRFGTGVSYVIVFASLLVKCVFLLSLHGGIYLPAAYQGLLLFFAVMIQVAIGAQWLGGSPARVAVGGARCDTALSELLLSLSYPAFLLAVVCGVALRSRGIRDNYREAAHIAGAGGACAAAWACWAAAAGAAGERHRDAGVAAGLLATAAVVFALMFAPKGRRLAALGREGRWDADRDEGLSSLGAAGSGYSPSFFHFKPVKYGMVGGAAPPVPPDRKEAAAQPADVAWFARPPPPLPPPPPPHPLLHYYYNYLHYHYMLPPGAPREEGVYSSAEPTFSTNPNVFFRGEPLHAGMMY